MSQREKSNSAEIARRHSQVPVKNSLLLQPPIQARANKEPQAQHYYQPTPPPETVVVHSIPKKTNDACCWGCAAALCLCFGLKECCSS